MRETLFLWVFVLFSLSKIGFSESTSGSLTIKEIIEKNAKAVLHISYYTGDPKSGFDQKDDFSGFVINEEGYVITAAHCLENYFKHERKGQEKSIYGFAEESPIIRPYGVISGSKNPIIPYFEILTVDAKNDIAILKPMKISKEQYAPFNFVYFDMKNVYIGEKIVSVFWNTEYFDKSDIPYRIFSKPNILDDREARSAISVKSGIISSYSVKDVLNYVLYSDYILRSSSSGSPVFTQESGGVLGIITGIRYDKNPTGESIIVKQDDGREIKIPIIVTPNAFSIICPNYPIIHMLKAHKIKFYTID